MKISKQELAIRKKFDWNTVKDRNCIKFDEKSGLKHKKAVMDYCWELLQEGEPFFTKARMKPKTTGFPHTNQLCADILIPEQGVVVEVIDSESDKSIERKREIWKKEGLTLQTIDVNDANNIIIGCDFALGKDISVERKIVMK